MSQVTGIGQPGNGRELPKYRSHKDVWALKIAAIEVRKPTIAELEAILKEEPDSGKDVGAIITPTDSGYAPFPVTHAYMVKHNPQPGGYWVLYKDGYQSWSPTEAFEEGYTRI